MYALVVRFLFGVRDWENFLAVMTVSFLFFAPFGVGALTIFLSPVEKVQSKAYRFFMPWAPIFVFFFITLVLAIEGWACWVMILPIFLLAASIGGWVAGHYKLRQNKKQAKLYVSLTMFLPLLLAPVEKMVELVPATYGAYTFIDIQAPAGTIWSNVTRVGEIGEAEDTGWLTSSLGFPRPIKAELDFEGVGARREAIFSRGLVFHETVKSYEHQKKMVFSIKAYPHEIPSATMDEHIVIGGDYFNVLDGTYELEKLPDGTHRLHLYSHFEMNTTFNFYAGWWGRWIMKDVQNNILRIVKQRAENFKG